MCLQKKHDKEKKIQVTCYDQLRYLKNKFSYVFENKTATEIIKSLCADFNLQTGEMDNTNYVISAIAEENKSALDIVLSVLNDTLLNTGNMFVLYDDFGKLTLRDVSNMTSLTLVYNESAENFDFSSSIDNETYNQIVLYYKQNDTITQIYTASSPSTIKQWGTLRYFEEVNTPTIGQNKANSLLKLYNKKTRELKVTGAFGDISVRGGTLIPVQLELDEILANNFMLLNKVTHKFDKDYHTMDLTLEGAWEDKEYEVVSKTLGELVKESSGSSGGYSGGSGSSSNGSNTDGSNTESNYSDTITKPCTLTVEVLLGYDDPGYYTITYYDVNEKLTIKSSRKTTKVSVDRNTKVKISFYPKDGFTCKVISTSGTPLPKLSDGSLYTGSLNKDTTCILRWTRV